MLSPLPWLLSILTISQLAHAQFSVTDYAPTVNVACPKDSPVREFRPNTQSLSALEASYTAALLATTLPGAWSAWLGDGAHLGYNLSALNASLPKVGIALSGGGYRAAQFAAGTLSALDGRDADAKKAGTGGLLQVAAYLAGLSGGSWALSSMYSYGWPDIQEMVLGNNKGLPGWMLDLFLAIPDGVNVFSEKNQAFYGSVLSGVEAKDKTGIDTSLVDPWSRMLSYHFLKSTDRSNFFTNKSAHGAGQLLSALPSSALWAAHRVPFPIVWANSRPAGSNVSGAVPLEAPVYEMTPAEFGSWDPSLGAFVDMAYAGTHFDAGKPENESSCLSGLDEMGFVMGTSSSLFNQFLDKGRMLLSGFGPSQAAGLIFLLTQQLLAVRTRADDVANWPNPFHNLAPSSFVDTQSRWLELIDGGSNNENLPLGALLVKARALDVLVAIDASNDIDDMKWPNGSALVVGRSRVEKVLKESHQPLPPLPQTTEEFVQFGLNLRPTFFGCEPGSSPPEWPLLIYFPNAPPLNGDDPVTNTDTLKLDYTLAHTRAFIAQSRMNALGGFLPNTTSPDKNFGTCLQCAALDRARFLPSNTTLPRSDVCSKCFAQYCFSAAHPSSKDDLPGRRLLADPDALAAATQEEDVRTFFERHKGAVIGGAVGALVVLAGAVGAVVWCCKRRGRGKYVRVRDASGSSMGAYELPNHR